MKMTVLKMIYGAVIFCRNPSIGFVVIILFLKAENLVKFNGYLFQVRL